jgi:nucleoside-diphosphate-sugar epimerase
MKVEGSKVLVTGAGGFLASHIIGKLADRGADVTGIDNLRASHPDNLDRTSEKMTFRWLDIRDAASLEKIIRGKDIVIHLAANADVRSSMAEPEYDFQVNGGGTHNVVRLAQELDVLKVIYASSAAVYGSPRYLPVDEAHPLNPISPYGASKLAGEHYGFAFMHSAGLCFSAFRIFNAYGPFQRRYVMYDVLTKLASRPRRIEMHGTQYHARDFVYVGDITAAFLAAIEKDEHRDEACNLGSGARTSIAEVVTVAAELLGIEGLEVAFTGRSWPGDVTAVVADVTRLSEWYQIEPSRDIRAGLSELARDLDLL